MNICGIVCEYNPFHNGHLYQLNQAKASGADAIVCVMSGNFVQRGDFAIMQKSARAKAAVMCGADVVIELPLPYALSSAERFAHGAVSILDKLKVVSHISFGAECENTDELTEVAKLLSSGELDTEIAEEYSKGVSYATARENAVRKFKPELSDILQKPNNILAVEYLKALLRLNSDIIPIAIKRCGAEHDASIAENGFAAASYIRELILSDKDISDLLPKESFEIFKEECSCGHAPISVEMASSAILASLKRLSADDFRKYRDVTEGLENRLFQATSESVTLSDAIARAKTKRYAHSRIRRIFLNAFLDIDASLASKEVPYARVLAFSERGREVLKSAKRLSEIPIITKPASIKFESKEAVNLFTLEKRADDIYSLFMKIPEEQGATLRKSPDFIS